MTERKYSARSLASLEGVHPDLRRVIDRALQESPLDFAVIEGLRDRERQVKLVAEGKSRTMNSRHITGHAVDLMPIDAATGRGSWDWGLYHRLGPAVERAAEAEGVPLVWGGRWTSFKDGPHFELERHAYPAGGDVPRASLAQSRTVQAQTVTGAATVGAAGVTQALTEASASLAPYADTLDMVRWALIGLALAGVAVTIYARVDDWRRGAR